jgi:rhodanese-related sulfurtransferase
MNDFVEFAGQNWLLFLALFAVIGMLLGGEILRKIRGVKTLNAAEALRLLNDQDAWIVDVRESADYKESHIPQAHHIPLAALTGRLGELSKAGDRPIIVYCRSGNTSESASALLRKNGITNVYSLSGGLTAWLDAHLPVTRKK